MGKPKPLMQADARGIGQRDPRQGRVKAGFRQRGNERFIDEAADAMALVVFTDVNADLARAAVSAPRLPRAGPGEAENDPRFFRDEPRMATLCLKLAPDVVI